MKYPSFNFCIYCDDTKRPRGDEHVIPFSLGGDVIIDDASCAQCAKIINQFETRVGRTIFGDFRMKYGLQTRRPKERPARIPLNMGGGGTHMVPVHKHPAPVVLYEYDLPGISIGLPRHLEMGNWRPVVIANQEEMKGLNEEYTGKVTFSIKLQPEVIARQLAKIAYCFSLIQLGTNFYRPLVRDLILGIDKNWSYLVGRQSRPAYGPFQNKHLIYLDFEQVRGQTLIAVDIALFTSIFAPRYRVIVGDVHTPENRAAFAKYLQNAESIIVSFP